MPGPTRRRLLTASAIATGLLAAARVGAPWLVRPREPLPLEDGDQARLDALLGELDLSQVVDMHAHVVGLGTGGSGCWVNPTMQDPLHPVLRFQYDMYLSAAGTAEGEDADQRYVAHLQDLLDRDLARTRILLLAFDFWTDENGDVRPEKSAFSVPNEWVLRLAEGRPDSVLAGASIHPYRQDAVDRLEETVARGARLVKWLPGSMGIDPASPLCDPFYRALARLGVPLLSHAGSERAVQSSEAHEQTNPLRLRRALEQGVKVIVAHCAGSGTAPDIDEPGAPDRPCFDLFLRMMDDPRWDGLLFADISAMPQMNRSGAPLQTMLERTDLHGRLLNGSDYPLCAIDPLVSTRQLVRLGYLDAETARFTRAVFAHNPLLFDLVVKRELRGRGGERFAPEVFERLPFFRPTPVAP
jgi:uncharacterized protein